MSGPVWLYEAIRMKCRDSGYVWNHGVFYFLGFVFMPKNPVALGYQFY